MKHLIEMDVTERTVQQVWVEADTPEEALRLVEEYEVENDTFTETACIGWFASNVRLVSPT